MDYKTLEKLGGRVTEISATYSRKMWSNEVGTIGGDFGASAEIIEGQDPEQVFRALFAWLKELAKGELKESFEALSKPEESEPEKEKAEPPLCPTHERPMSKSKYGGWYCTAKIADDDGTGEPVYCKQKVKDD